MATSPLYSAICKLAIAGEKAGFTVEQMIQLLNAGIPVETLVDIIEERLSPEKPLARSINGTSRYIM